MIKKKNKKNLIGLLIVGIILICIPAIEKAIQFFKIDSCLDKGGSWNSHSKKCECLYTIDTNRIADYCWKADFDSITNHEYLKRGKMLDSISGAPFELIEILNKRQSKSKIIFAEIKGDTIVIKILNDEYLTEQMGTSGADCYMAETIYTLTENNLIQFVRFEMDYGSHASPGLYSRNDYERMIKK